MPSIEFEIDNANWSKFVSYFCMTHPNQTKESGTPLSDEDWVKYRILLFARGSYIKGLQEEYDQQNGPDIDMDIITL